MKKDEGGRGEDEGQEKSGKTGGIDHGLVNIEWMGVSACLSLLLSFATGSLSVSLGQPAMTEGGNHKIHRTLGV